MKQEEQQFLDDLDKRRCDAANRLRSAVNLSEFMHVVLGLVFLKYISDAFKERRLELQATFKDPANDFMDDDAGEMIAQELEARDFKPEETARVAKTFRACQRGTGYADEAGFCNAVKLEGVRKADCVLTPGRCVGGAVQEADAEPYVEKMARLTTALGDQFKESSGPEAAIRKSLAGLGYAI